MRREEDQEEEEEQEEEQEQEERRTVEKYSPGRGGSCLPVLPPVQREQKDRL